jgi:hypothetical protein
MERCCLPRPMKAAPIAARLTAADCRLSSLCLRRTDDRASSSARLLLPPGDCACWPCCLRHGHRRPPYGPLNKPIHYTGRPSHVKVLAAPKSSDRLARREVAGMSTPRLLCHCRLVRQCRGTHTGSARPGEPAVAHLLERAASAGLAHGRCPARAGWPLLSLDLGRDRPAWRGPCGRNSQRHRRAPGPRRSRSQGC